MKYRVKVEWHPEDAGWEALPTDWIHECTEEEAEDSSHIWQGIRADYPDNRYMTVTTHVIEE